MRRVGAAGMAVLAAFWTLAVLPRPAEAKKRKVAVLEYRAGTQGASELGMRLAEILRVETSLQVVDLDDARRIAGSGMDGDVAKCRGEAPCVAALGKRLGVDEVILVGVSEFGDLIVTLQRIRVSGAEVKTRVAESLPRGTEPDDGALESYLKKLMPPEDFKRFGTIHIRTDMKGADVSVGGKKQGVTPLDPILVPAPSKVEVKVVKSGYLPYALSIDVPPEAVVEVRPVFEKNEQPGWYKKWWVWAIVGGVVAGATVTTVVLLQPAPDSVPGTIEWNGP